MCHSEKNYDFRVGRTVGRTPHIAGLKVLRSQKLAYDYAYRNRLKVPESWTRDEKAGK